MKSIALYTHHYDNFIINEANLKRISIKRAMFDEIDKKYYGRFLRYFNGNNDEGILLSEVPIRENKALAKYLYSGNDYAKNYLIDNGYFVPNDKFSLKNNINHYHNEVYYQYYNKYYRMVYDDNSYHNISVNGLRHLYEEVSSDKEIPQCVSNRLNDYLSKENNFYDYNSKPSESKNIKYSSLKINATNLPLFNDTVEEQFKKANSEGFLKFKEEYEKEKYDNFGKVFGLIFSLIMCIVFNFLFWLNNPKSSFIFSLFLIIFLPFIGVKLWNEIKNRINIKKYFETMKQGPFVDKNVIKDQVCHDLSDYAKNINNKISKYIDKAINISFDDLHFEEREIISSMNNNADLSSLLQTNCTNGNYIRVELEDLNIVYNLMMYCSYPYTMVNGEIFNAVYARSDYDFYTSLRGNLNLITNYFEYMESFVYPMVRQYGRNGMTPVDLNSYVINEIRIQMRHEEMLNKLNTLNNTIKEAKRVAENIYSSIIETQNIIKSSSDSINDKLDEINSSIKDIEFTTDVYVSVNGKAHCYVW